MKSDNGRAFITIISLALVFTGPFLFAQVKEQTIGTGPNSGVRTTWAGFDGAGLLRALDPDQDGFITENEWGSFFADHDDDKNKLLSRDEIQPVYRQNNYEEELEPDRGRLKAFERLDANNSDAIESSEWAGKDKNFRNLDANRNGSLSREEFLSSNGRWWNELFEDLDFNEDRIIDRSEWLDSDASFDRLDRDHNGVIQRHEFYNPR